MAPHTQLIVALDLDSLNDARKLVTDLGDSVTWYKVGKQLFTRYGPHAVTALKDMGKKVFLDLKFHDIPNTVAQAVRSAASLGADMTNVHAGGGPAMLRAAAESAQDCELILVAVTVLTSMDTDELHSVGVTVSPEKQVLRLARLAQNQGVHGVVCSGHEIAPLRQACGDRFVLVVPGIRPATSQHGDQKRVMTPADAARAGADYIVVGRPIRAAADPVAAAHAVAAELT
ncbi:MAG: orotidine-5'-phosphate decarboxylase [Candidatus Pacebacteria bacterium]|nr:orotidine-5'-phosphate decarboxylase [Candidatus Paceibacterota bacterium]